MYCDGLCKNLDEKKHICNLTGERLTYMRYGNRNMKFVVHEHNGVCEHDIKNKGETENE